MLTLEARLEQTKHFVAQQLSWQPDVVVYTHLGYNINKQQLGSFSYSATSDHHTLCKVDAFEQSAFEQSYLSKSALC